VKYLAGAYRTANGDHDRAVHYYAAGYYEAAKHWRREHATHAEPVLASAESAKTEASCCKREAACQAKTPRENLRRRRDNGSPPAGKHPGQCKRCERALTPPPIGLH